MNLHFGEHSVAQFPAAFYTPTTHDELPHPISGPVRVVSPPKTRTPIFRRPVATPIRAGSGSASVGTPPTYQHITTSQQPRGVFSRLASGLFA
jgi:hypothetical protein